MTIAAAQLGLIGSADAQSNKTNPAKVPPIKAEASISFGTLKQIDAGLLNVGYAEAGPANGPAVILLHGWPYDIHSYVDVAPLLASAGYRVIVPYLRGYGSTRFLSNETFRNGQQSVIAVDIIALMDALKIGKAIIGGFDWGARTANIMAAVWPERCKALVSVSGYLIGNRESNKMPLPPKAELERKYDDLEKRLAEGPVITVPTITLEGDANGAPHPDASSYAKKFSGKYAHRIIKGGVGHNPPQEAPQAFAKAVIDVDGF